MSEPPFSSGVPDHEALKTLGDLLAAVEAGRQGVQEIVHVEGDPELAFNGALVLISHAIDHMNYLRPEAGTIWYNSLRQIARGGV